MTVNDTYIYIYIYLWGFPFIGIPHNHPKLDNFSTQRRPQTTGHAAPFSCFFWVGWGGCQRPSVCLLASCVLRELRVWVVFLKEGRSNDVC